MTDKKKELLRAVKFFLFSTSAGIIQTLSFTLMNEVFEWNYSLCYLTALILSVLWNFTFNRKFTFQAANNVPIAMLNVAVFYLIFTPLTTWGGQTLESKGWNEYIVLGLSMLLNLVTEYLYQRYIVFGKVSDKLRKVWTNTVGTLIVLSMIVLSFSVVSAAVEEYYISGAVWEYLRSEVKRPSGAWLWIALPVLLIVGLVAALIMDKCRRRNTSKQPVNE